MPWYLGLVVGSSLDPITDGTQGTSSGDGNDTIMLVWTRPFDYASGDTYAIFSQMPMVSVDAAVLATTPDSVLLDRAQVSAISGDTHQTGYYVQHVRGAASSVTVLILTVGITS